MAPATSPSEISRIRAPAPRTSAISFSCRGRSRMQTVMSDTDALRTLAMRWMLAADRRGDVDEVGDVGAGGDLVHVEHRRRVEHRAALGDGEHRDRVGHALGHQRGAVDRVDGEVAVGAVAVAHLLAVVEHRGVVLLALADHHDAAHRHRVDQLAHGVDGRAVAALLVAAADPAARRHRARLGHPDQFQGQVAVGGFAAAGVRHGADCPRTGPRVQTWDTGSALTTMRSAATRRSSAVWTSPAEPIVRALPDPNRPSPGCCRTAATCSGRWCRWWWCASCWPAWWACARSAGVARRRARPPPTTPPRR